MRWVPPNFDSGELFDQVVAIVIYEAIRQVGLLRIDSPNRFIMAWTGAQFVVLRASAVCIIIDEEIVGAASEELVPQALLFILNDFVEFLNDEAKFSTVWSKMQYALHEFSPKRSILSQTCM